jgi:hypothetical protein
MISSILRAEENNMKLNVLELIRNNPDGIESDSAESIICDQLHIDTNTSQKIINDLISDKQLKLIKINKITRYQATENQNYKCPKTFIEIGSPQSIQAMTSLNKTISSYVDEITIVIDVTSPKVFSCLEERLRHKLKTIIIFPPNKEIDSERLDNYKKIIKEWKMIYKNNKNYKSLTLLKSKIINKSIRTSLLTKEFARINIRDFHSKTTRNGVIVEVDSNNTLYNQYSIEIGRQKKYALPFFTLNPITYFCKKFLEIIINICLLVIAYCFMKSQENFLLLLSIISSGVIVGLVNEKYNNIKNHR